VVTEQLRVAFRLVVPPLVAKASMAAYHSDRKQLLLPDRRASGNGHLMHPYFGARTQARSGQTGNGRPLGGKAQSQPRDAAGAGPGPGDRCASTPSTAKLPTLLMLVQCHRCMWKGRETWVLIKSI
jgi:hypothetical protein